jgi:hypothetical protein
MGVFSSPSKSVVTFILFAQVSGSVGKILAAAYLAWQKMGKGHGRVLFTLYSPLS